MKAGLTVGVLHSARTPRTPRESGYVELACDCICTQLCHCVSCSLDIQFCRTRRFISRKYFADENMVRCRNARELVRTRAWWRHRWYMQLSSKQKAKRLNLWWFRRRSTYTVRGWPHAWLRVGKEKNGIIIVGPRISMLQL